MNLFDAVRKECVRAHRPDTEKQQALAAIAGLAVRSPALAGIEAATLEDALAQREDLGSTGFGDGIAIPHCRLGEVKEFVVGLVTFPDGVAFDALDEQPVRLMVFIIAPATESDQHVRILSGISRVLSIPGAVDEMVAATSDEALYESFLRFARDKADTSESMTRQLIHVFVQDEDAYRDILQVFGAMEDAYAVLVEAENLSAYLAKMPLFSSFWSDDPKTFCRVLVGVINKQLTNEAVRQIESITGDLREQTGVMVVVQDLFFCEGALHP